MTALSLRSLSFSLCSLSAFSSSSSSSSLSSYQKKGAFFHTQNEEGGEREGEGEKKNVPEWLGLRRLSRDEYESKMLWLPPLSRGVYGGHIVAQSLFAAQLNLKERERERKREGEKEGGEREREEKEKKEEEEEEEYVPKSQHSHFLNPCSNTSPVLYRVSSLREGKSSRVKMIEAIQGNTLVYHATAVFQKKGEKTNPFSHQTKLPPLDKKYRNMKPDHFPSDEDRLRAYEAHPNLSPQYNAWFKELSESSNNIIESHDTDPIDILNPEKKEGPHHFWLRMKSQPSDSSLDLFSFPSTAYLSDWKLPLACLRPHGLVYPNSVKMASMDHHIWWHTESISATKWLLCHAESPRKEGDRGMVYGRYSDEDGQHVMSVMQEISVLLR